MARSTATPKRIGIAQPYLFLVKASFVVSESGTAVSVMIASVT
jgi:hypothetical protein